MIVLNVNRLNNLKVVVIRMDKKWWFSNIFFIINILIDLL